MDSRSFITKPPRMSQCPGEQCCAHRDAALASWDFSRCSRIPEFRQQKILWRQKHRIFRRVPSA